MEKRDGTQEVLHVSNAIRIHMPGSVVAGRLEGSHS